MRSRKPQHLVVSANREQLAADGADLVYFTVRVADRNGNIVPTDSRKVSFEVSGAGSFEATANGDPTCLMPFQNPEMKLFSGSNIYREKVRIPKMRTFSVDFRGNVVTLWQFSHCFRFAAALSLYKIGGTRHKCSSKLGCC